MKARPALVVSAILTAFSLVMIGALIGRVSRINPASDAATADVATINPQATSASNEPPRIDLLDHSPTSEQGNPPDESLISAEDAVQIAQQYLGTSDGSVERVELEEEHGNLVYEIRFIDKNRVYVDAISGVVVYARIDDDHDEDHDRDDDE